MYAREDTLWAGVNNIVYQSRDESMHPVARIDEGDKISSILKTNDGALLAGTSQGYVFRLNPDGKQDTLLYTYSAISAIYETAEADIWIGTGTGAMCLGDKGRNLAGGSPIRTFCEDTKGNLLCGSATGLWCVPKEGQAREIPVGGNRLSPIKHVFCDRDGGIWVGTHFDGIFYHSPTSLSIRRIESCGDYKIRLVRALTKDNNGNIGIFTDNCGMFIIDRSFKDIRYDPRGRGVKFQCACFDRATGNYWCGEYNGSLIRIDSNGIHRIPFVDSDGKQFRRTIYTIIRNKGNLYIGCDEGLFVFNPSVESEVKRCLCMGNDSVFCLYAENDVLWVGSYGLFRYDLRNGSCVRPFGSASPLFGEKCCSIIKGKDNSLIISLSRSGVCKITDGKEAYYDSVNCGLESEETSFTSSINDSLVMVGTISGLSIIDTQRHISLNCSSSNTPFNLSMRRGCALMCEDGIMASGGKDGVTLLDTKSLSLDVGDIPFFIDEFVINNRNIAPVKPFDGNYEITLEHNETDINIGIAVPEYTRIRSQIYQYKLEGFDKSWNDFSRDEYISFTNLSAGSYTLRIRGGNSLYGNFIEQSIRFRIKRAWYASTAAITLWSLVLIATIVTLLMQAYSRVMLRNKLMHEKMVTQERTKLFIDISHRLRTPLTMILGDLELFFHHQKEKFPGRKEVEASLRNAERMRDIISEYVDIEDQAEKSQYSYSPDEGSKDSAFGIHAYKMLIVDDNEDIRSLLRGIFSSEYDLIEAENGGEGLAMARSNQPDIIISDVQMPGMDGITMCSELRKDFTTRHIPIILLTAHASEKHNLEGILMGADDYITKPFKAALLKAKCHNLIENRIMLRDKFLLTGDKKPDRPMKNKNDERFINAAIGAVERNLGSSDLDVVKLCSELSMSRTSLSMNLQRLTGMTPGLFIEDIKLKRAAMMLKETPLQIKEISDELGFSNPKYFTLRFKKKYGCPPNQYR
ncbi:MAG: response regulator [Bacteroidales bacterium]|nr:response regulator [Bacteroidales bacterium]